MNFEYYKELTENDSSIDWKLKFLDDFHKTIFFTVGYDIEKLKTTKIDDIHKKLFGNSVVTLNYAFGFHGDGRYINKYLGKFTPTTGSSYDINLSEFVENIFRLDLPVNTIGKELRTIVGNLEPKTAYYETQSSSETGIKVKKLLILLFIIKKLDKYEENLHENFISLHFSRLLKSILTVIIIQECYRLLGVK